MINHPNSVWPNGLKKDGEGYAIFYPLGTNKVDVGTVVWPTGDKLISPYVYQNNKLVGFCDTQAMTVSNNTTISLPYTHIEADFSSIEEGKLTVDAPNATVKKFKWKTVVLNGDEEEVIEPDTRTFKTKYDIWANAEVENEDGTIEIKNLYIPDASGWMDDHGQDFGIRSWVNWSANESDIISVIDNKMYVGDASDESNLLNPVANMDTSKIVDGSYLYQQSGSSPFGSGGE